MLLNDEQIAALCAATNMIEPFSSGQIRTRWEGNCDVPAISYGCSSFGYDIRLGRDFKVFTNAYGAVVDPKAFDERAFVQVQPTQFDNSVLIPPNSFALGVSFERLKMPRDVMAICVGKSTYARCGIVVNVTPIEAGWEGYITIEISNTTPLPAKVYAEEGIAQLLFFGGHPPRVSYADRAGKYQNQAASVTLPKV